MSGAHSAAAALATSGQCGEAADKWTTGSAAPGGGGVTLPPPNSSAGLIRRGGAGPGCTREDARPQFAAPPCRSMPSPVSCSALLAALLPLLLLGRAAFGREQIAAVQGTLMCGQSPAHSVRVALYDEDVGE